jgi:CelD/BcsL family acetyltransferase involved in cellulose biosynthesis
VQTDQTIQVEVWNSFEDLQTIQAEWDKFVESVGGEIFLTYDWCRIWWKYYGNNRDLRVFIFRSNGKLVGIIPLFFERIWLGLISVCAAKIVGSDFTISHFSLPILRSCTASVSNRFAELLSKSMCDVICIGPLAGLYKGYNDLIETLKQSVERSHAVFGVDIGVHTYYRMAQTWEEYLAGLRKKERQLIRNAYRRIERGELTLISELASINNFKEKFDGFVRTHQSHWQSIGKAGHFGDWPLSVEFHREVARAQLEHGRLRLLEVRLSEACSGYQYSYRFGDTYLSVLPARPAEINSTKIPTGKVLFSEQLKNAIDEKITYIDSMQAKYEYKLRLGGELLSMRAIYVCRKGILAAPRIFMFRVLSKLLDICYFKIWYCRIAPMLPFKRRPLWRIWIRSNAFAE